MIFFSIFGYSCTTDNKVINTNCENAKASIIINDDNENKINVINHLHQDKESSRSVPSEIQHVVTSRLNAAEEKNYKKISVVENGKIPFNPPIIKISLMNNDEIIDEFDKLDFPISKKPAGQIVIVATTPETTFYSEEKANNDNSCSKEGEQLSL